MLQSDSHRPLKIALLGLAAAMFVCFGAAILRGEFHFYRQGAESEAWPSTNGIVTQSRVEDLYRSNDRRLYRPAVEYRYQVGDLEYLSSRIRLGNTESYDKNGIARKLVENYYFGKEVIVFYDPRDPKLAILEPGIQWTTYLGFIGGPILIVVGVFLARWVVLELRDPGSVMSV